MIQRLRAAVAFLLALGLWVVTLGRADLDWKGEKGPSGAAGSDGIESAQQADLDEPEPR